MSPRVVYYVPKDWSAALEVLRLFASANALDLRTDGIDQSEGYRHFYVSACTEEGVQVSVVDSWAPGMPEHSSELHITVFETRSGAPWKRYSDQLQVSLEARWPGAVRAEVRSCS